MKYIEIIYKLLLLLFYVMFIILSIYLYLKSSKPYPHKKLELYLKTPPEHLNPIELSILIYRKIVPQTLTATIYYLINIKALTITKEKKDTYIYRNPDFKGKLSHSQKFTIELLIDIMGDHLKMSLTKIGTYCNTSIGASEFLLNYDIWKRIAIKEGNKKKFFEDKTNYSFVKFVRNFGFTLFILNIILRFNLFMGYFAIIPAMFIIVYFYNIYKRTEKYNDEFYNWLAFANYLQDIKNQGWDKKSEQCYLIYSLILNKVEYVEPVLCKDCYLSILNESITKCVSKANLHGSRKFSFR